MTNKQSKDNTLQRALDVANATIRHMKASFQHAEFDKSTQSRCHFTIKAHTKEELHWQRFVADGLSFGAFDLEEDNSDIEEHEDDKGGKYFTLLVDRYHDVMLWNVGEIVGLMSELCFTYPNLTVDGYVTEEVVTDDPRRHIESETVWKIFESRRMLLTRQFVEHKAITGMEG